jgi:hypothetical protein
MLNLYKTSPWKNCSLFLPIADEQVLHDTIISAFPDARIDIAENPVIGKYLHHLQERLVLVGLFLSFINGLSIIKAKNLTI